MNPLLAGGVLVGIHQVMITLSIQDEINAKYSAAEAYANEVGKPLLVVGGPYGSTFSGKMFGIRAHGGGDVCVDMDAASCRGCNFVPGDIRGLPFTDKEFGSAFCSHVLEHMGSLEDIEQAYTELHRVADSVFICVPPKSSIRAHTVSDHYLWVEEVEPGVLEVEERWSGGRKGTVRAT